MQLGMVGEELDVARLQNHVQAQLVAQRQRVVQPNGFLLLLAQPGHLRVTLRQLVVGGQIWRAQVSLRRWVGHGNR